MKKNLLVSILAVLALALAAGCEVSTANLQDVKLCSDAGSDDMCESDESTFAPDTEEIFVTGNLENAPEDTKLTITWTYLGEEGDDPEEIDTVELVTENTSNTFYSSYEVPAGGWPAGEYEIVLDLGTDNSDPVVKSFTVEGDAQPVSSGDDPISDLKTCDDLTTGDELCQRDLETFDPEVTEIFLTGLIGAVPPDTELSITWRYLGGDDLEAGVLDTISVTATDTPNTFFSNLPAPVNGWPAGDYEIVIELDGDKEATKEFSVE